MRGGRELLGLTLWLAFCSLRLHAFHFPFFDTYTSQQDVDAINDLYAALGSPDLEGWTDFGGDPCKDAWQGVKCDGPNVTEIELQGVGLGGKLSQTLGDFTAVTLLDLRNNQIGGMVPQSLPPSLTQLDLSSNSLSGELPDSMAQLSSLSTLRDGNKFTIPTIPGSPTPPVVPSRSPPSPKHVPASAAPQEPPVLSGYLRRFEMRTSSWVRVPPRLSAVAKPEKEHHSGAEEKIDWPSRVYVKEAGSSVRSSFKNSSKDITVSDKNVQGSAEGQTQQIPFTFFTVASMQQHTNNFSDLNLIRETCFGKMYLADHPGGKFSVLKLDGDAAKMPAAEFLKIVQGISELRHPNVEELVGCCVEHGQRLLVYNHFSDITLDSMMHFEHRASETAETLQWDARVAIALEAATALEYLHEGSQKQVVHRHFRPEHVLIDGDLKVSVSGCGLAPFVPQVSDYCTLSYEPPEAAADTGGAAWTAKGDVYSFGVVMLQLLTGRRPYDSSRARGEWRLVQWASPRLHDLAALGKMADPRLGSPPVRSLSRFADIIGRCIQQEAEFRPAMAEVAQDLRRALEDAAIAAEPAGSGGKAQV
nr:unnamed protein product [Digitaria exilis]